MRVTGRPGDPLRVGEILFEPLHADPPVDQPPRVNVLGPCLQHQPTEVDEPLDRVLGITALAAASILILALRGAVSRPKRLVKHVDRVVGRLSERLGAEARQHRVAPPLIQARQRLTG